MGSSLHNLYLMPAIIKWSWTYLCAVPQNRARQDRKCYVNVPARGHFSSWPKSTWLNHCWGKTAEVPRYVDSSRRLKHQHNYLGPPYFHSSGRRSRTMGWRQIMLSDKPPRVLLNYWPRSSYRNSIFLNYLMWTAKPHY